MVQSGGRGIAVNRRGTAARVVHVEVEASEV